MIEKILEKALNKFIGLSPEANNYLKPLTGKTLALEVLGANLILYFIFNEEGAAVSKQFEGDVAATIKGYPFSLLSIMKRKTMAGSGISINGEAEAAESLKNLLGHLDIDWEELLSHITGDSVAHHIGNLSRGVLSSLANIKDSLADNLGEYFTEETKTIIPKVELEVFYNDVDELNLSVERLAARIKKLEVARENH